jgi:hypothetical protein
MMLKLHEWSHEIWSKNVIFKYKNYVPHLLFHIQIIFFQQFQHHNITSDKLSDQNNEKFYYVKQTVENRRPSKMGDVVTLLFVHFNFIIQFRNTILDSSSAMTLIMYILRLMSGADPGFQVRGADLKKLRRAEGGANIFGVFRRRPSKMGDVVTLLFVHFNFIIQFRNMFFFLKSSTLHIFSSP